MRIHAHHYKKGCCLARQKTPRNILTNSTGNFMPENHSLVIWCQQFSYKYQRFHEMQVIKQIGKGCWNMLPPLP